MEKDYINDRTIDNINKTISPKRKFEDEEEKGSMKQPRVTRIPLPISKQESYLAQLPLVEYCCIRRSFNSSKTFAFD